MTFNIRIIFSLFLFVFSGISFSSDAQFIFIKTIGGDGLPGFNSDGIVATTAELNGPTSITLDPLGNVYFVDYNNYRVRKIGTDGIITTVAGTGTTGYTTYGGLATSADIWPHGVVMDKNYNLYISDVSRDVIDKVSPTGIITQFAGNSELGYSGDDSIATNARMNSPYGLAVDDTGNLYIADAGNNVIRKVNITTGIITTVAGNGLAANAGNGGLAIYAALDSPLDVAVDKYGNLFISDYKNQVIRKVTAATGIISTYAGTGVQGYNRDTILATTAQLNNPVGIAVDTNGFLYIADAGNNLVRVVDTNDMIWRVAGNRTAAFGGDLGLATGANLNQPYGVVVDTFGNIYIADANNQRIRETYNTLGVPTIANNNDIATYPNPFAGAIYVKGLNSGDKVCLYNIIGQAVTEVIEVKNAGENELNASASLPAGIYLLQVWDDQGNKKSVERVVKN